MILDLESRAMQNKSSLRHVIFSGVLNACLLMLLLTTTVIAQQSATEHKRNIGPDNSPETANSADNPLPTSSKPAPNTKNLAPLPPPPAMQFTPSEKIRADDAVSFPVDI